MRAVFIISAPSGSGKSTLVNALMDRVPDLRFSISYTTRSPRGTEEDGKDYYFVSREDFEAMAARGEFLEYAEVFGHYYGTHVSELSLAQRAEQDLVLDIDVQGARQLQRKIPDAVRIFILAPSRAELEQRLRARSDTAQEVIERRLRGAADEIRDYGNYDYVLVNREVAASVDTLCSIVKAERVRRTRIEDQIRPILATFERSEVSNG
jgi:guanylate kinase